VKRQDDGEEDQEGQRIEDHRTLLPRPFASLVMYSAP